VVHILGVVHILEWPTKNKHMDTMIEYVL